MVGDHFALPFLDSHHFFRNLNGHIFTDLHLAAQSPLLLLFLTGKETRFCGKDGSATFQYLATAHSAGSATATGRRQKNIIARQCAKHGRSWRYSELLVINLQLHIALRGQFEPGIEQHGHQQEDYKQENADTDQYDR